MSRTARWKVVVAEDHFLTRFAVVSVLAEQPDFEVVAQTESGSTAVSLFRKHRPDLVIMDLRIDDLDGFAATRAIRADDAAARVLVLSSFEKDADVTAAFEAGALGFLGKDVSAQELLEAARTVARGGRHLQQRLRERPPAREEATALSKRELEVLTLIFKGKSNREIAAETGLTEGTVRIYTSRILMKLGVKRRTEAVAVALELGLIKS